MPADFSRRTQGLLDRANEVCRQRGVTLTEVRRQVLGLILDAASPTGAYELLDRLRQTRRSAAPPTVYRAIDFLMEQGLIHRVQRLAAFVGCIAGCSTDSSKAPHTHAVQFLICQECGCVTEMQDQNLSAVLAGVAESAGFTVHNSTIEAEGICGACMSAAQARTLPN